MQRIDVIIPCYNYGRFLRDCLHSVLTQDGCAVRVLLIDDCSTDDSLATARALVAGEPRVELRVHEINKGHIATYNEGIDWLSAPFMLLLSADDIVAPGAFARALALMEARPQMAFLYGRSLHFRDNDPVPTESPDAPMPTHWRSGRAFIESQCDRPVNPVDTPTAIVRTRCHKVAGHYDPALPHAGDMHMWLRLATLGEVGFVDGVQAFVRIHGINMRNAYAGPMLGDLRQRTAVFRDFFARHAATLPDAARLEAKVSRRLAAEMLWEANRALAEDPAADVTSLRAMAHETAPGLPGHLLSWRFHARRLAGPTMWRAAGRAREMLRNTAR
jgi:Glycosyl transferase family 2